MTLVSIVIPHFNRAETMTRCLNSVLTQSYQNYECLVIDDGSKEEELQFLKRIIETLNDRRFRLILHAHNKGGGAARNTGIENAEGEFIAFLDSDDEWRSDKLSKQLSFMIDNSIVFSSCQSEVHYAHGVDCMPLIPPASGQGAADYLFVDGGWLPTPSLMVRRQDISSIRFDESLPRHQDYDFILALEKKGISPSVMMEPLVVVHWENMHSSGRAHNVKNSINFLNNRSAQFSKRASSCFWVQFVVIPSIILEGRLTGLHQLRKTTMHFVFANRNLALNVFSHILFCDGRILRWAHQIIRSKRN